MSGIVAEVTETPPPPIYVAVTVISPQSAPVVVKVTGALAPHVLARLAAVEAAIGPLGNILNAVLNGVF
jgi:hypothetical protein